MAKKHKSIETRGIRISEDGYKKVYRIKDIMLELGLRKQVHLYEIIDEALDFYMQFLEMLKKFQNRKK